MMVYCTGVVGALWMGSGIGIVKCSKRTGNHEEVKELSSDVCGSNAALAALRDRQAVN